MRKRRIAINADLDGTLADGMHPDLLLDRLRISREEFWNGINKEQDLLRQGNFENHIALYFTRLIDAINNYNDNHPHDIITRDSLVELGQGLDGTLKPGVKDFLIDLPADNPDYEFSLRVISSGMKPIIQGSFLGEHCDHICAYDLVPSHYTPNRFAGMGLTVSSDEKENIIVRMSIGNSKVRGKYDWPLADTLILGDGLTDIPMFKVGKNYGSHCIGIISDEAIRQTAAEKLAHYVHEIHFGDYRRGSDLRKSIDGFLQERR